MASHLHIFLDRLDWGFDVSLQEHTYGLQETGFDFSKHGAFSCTIYDKTRKLRRSGKEWFLDLWQSRGWDEVEDGAVWRVEFKREALHELEQEGVFHGVEDVYDSPKGFSPPQAAMVST